ncbi:hypothetical protein VQ643_08210 [Pseudomonas sp. F1_0610]|uniref:hypothetical protein n=1 Tax=Pseudomonas sp. F1_0610 TaxID=3114284 RepID=UPI0039C257E4
MAKKLSLVLAATVCLISTSTLWAEELSDMAAEKVVIPELDEKQWREDYSIDLPPKKLQELRESGQIDQESMLANESIKGYTLAEWVTGEETAQNWTKLLSAQFFEGVHDPVESFAISFAEQLKASCSDISLEMLERTSNSVLIEWDTRQCEYLGIQHELTRFIASDRGWHRIAYTEMKPQMDKEVRDHWLELLKAATIETVASESAEKAETATNASDKSE